MQRGELLRFSSVLSAQSAVKFLPDAFAQPRRRSGLFGSNLGAADKGSGLIHDQARRFDITAHSATSPQLATFLGRDIAVYRAVYDD